ncbi:MAG TPA: HesA/MoeB/ThiF family protein [Desulfobulbus sp.]|nr:HesA/MoeB/ThiF family protein [Desulfobulbus sp.]
MSLSEHELGRYRRQLILDGWGPGTQEKLRNSKVFVAGAGGLGCAAALNLTLAGVGHIRICDSDTVELTNLNRQFLHPEQNIGREKTLSATETLRGLNSAIAIEPVTREINEESVAELVGDADLILDCLDNFPGRYTLSKHAAENSIPLVFAAIWGMEGRLTFLHPPATPCLSCLFPRAPERHEIPVLGGVACTSGSLQALEAINYLSSSRPTLAGRMLIMDYQTMRFQELEIARNPDCPVCGSRGQEGGQTGA